MKSVHMTVPSKTFLLGEYVALKKGPALVLSTQPYFELVAAQNSSKDSEIEIHPESPAGKWMRRYPDFYQNYHVQFIDPYQKLGGFGASSAQFIMVYALKYFIEDKPLKDSDLLKDYESVAWNGEGLAPSGADVIAQVHGGLCFFHKAQKKVKSFSWPFEELAYALIHTGQKLATHQHLEKLEHLDTVELEAIVRSGLVSIEQADNNGFVDAIRRYATALHKQGLVAKHTHQMLERLTRCPEILAAKGCGALGADVILVLFYRQSQDNVINWLKANKFNTIAFGHKIAQGLTINQSLSTVVK